MQKEKLIKESREMGNWIDFDFNGSDEVQLDGYFSTKDLKAIIWKMKQCNKLYKPTFD